MKATCTKDTNHKEFLTPAHVAQTWKVDEDGDFLGVFSNDDTISGPNSGNIWTCAICGAEAIVEDE